MKVATQVATTNVALIALIAFSIHTIGSDGLWTLLALPFMQTAHEKSSDTECDKKPDENQSTLDEYGGTDGKGIQASEVKT